MNRVLLHVCCGVCSGWPTEKLRSEGYEVTWYFYNPNISPKDEYDRRLDTVRAAARFFDVPLIEGAYDAVAWLSAVAGMDNEPEGGARCAVCFRLRLRSAAEMARSVGAGFFSSTLTVSPHKEARVVNAIGTALGLNRFLAMDFKKEDGFRKTTALADGQALYRQSYCGCSFSKVNSGDTTLNSPM